jgi:hypothetical protein
MGGGRLAGSKKQSAMLFDGIIRFFAASLHHVDERMSPKTILN